ncbi:MAG TPA: glycosyltransferase [Acidobacteriaceae bacterium]|jgi:glycosyltransferase involved in cell wall biosynthesis|nr:glycosyltransferase [Acidobacteriaceae bacterium]
MAQRDVLVTVLINNYNYGLFLNQAIDSALNQTYQNIEVVVVDDGSTDESRDIILGYGDNVVKVLKENGGQASAFNAGIGASRGEVICMLDSDDWFFPDKVERLIPYSRPSSILHHRLQMQPGPGLIPSTTVEPIDVYAYARRYRFIPFGGSPTSGIAISRDLAVKLLPFPKVRASADDFLVRGAALLGNIIGIPEVLGAYRIHGNNVWYGTNSRKSDEFNRELERYLNEKLVTAGKEPVIDFFHSMYGRESVPQNAAELSRLAISVFRHHSDLVTFKFMVKTLALGLKRAVPGS